MGGNEALLERLRERERRRLTPEAQASGGRLVASNTPSPQITLPSQPKQGGVSRLVSRLVTPLVDVPTLPGGIAGRVVEQGIEGLTSPVGLASAALIPFTGGTSLGLRGAAGLGARLATRGAAEAAVGGVAGVAAQEATKRLPENAPSLVKLGVGIGAGAVAGGAAASGIGRAFRSGTTAAAAIPIEDTVKAATPEADEFVGALKLAREQLNDKTVRRAIKKETSTVIGQRVQAGREAMRDVAGNADAQQQAFLSQMRGQLPRIDFPELNVTPDVVERLKDQIIQSDALLELEKMGNGGALDALMGMVLNRRIPAPAELDKLERVFGKSFSNAVEALRPYGLKERVLDVLNLPRAVLASFDASFPFNQGALVASVSPRESVKMLGKSLRALVDEDFANMSDDWVRGATGDAFHKDWVNVIRKHGLEITGATAKPEEAFIAKKMLTGALFQKNLAGEAFKASDRSYTTAANYIRTITTEKVGRQLAEIYGGIENIPPSELKTLAKTANVLTGRGTLGSLEKISPVMNAAFFAPRFVLSRFEAPVLLLKRPAEIIKRTEDAAIAALPKGTAADEILRVAAEARHSALRDPSLYLNDPILRMQAKGLGGFMAQGLAGLTAIKLAKEAGFLGDNFSVEVDPRSSDFGKIRVGSMRYDFWGGYSQIARTLARTITQETKTTSGDIRPMDGAFDAVWDQFTRSKLAPIPGLLWDVKTGENYVGDRLITPGEEDVPNDLANQFRDRMLPLFIQDVMRGYMEQGSTGAAMALPAFVGIRTNSFTTMTDTRNNVTEDFFPGKKYEDLTGVQQRLINADPRVVKKAAESQHEPYETFQAAKTAIDTERIQTEDLVVQRLLFGQESPKTFADRIERQQVIAAAKRDEAARQHQIGEFQANSVAEQTLSRYYDLYKQADIGWVEGKITWEIDWEKYNQLEKDFLASLSPDLRKFVDERSRTQHGLAQPYFDNKDYIRESGYRDIVDEVFGRYRDRVAKIAPDITSYGGLTMAIDVATVAGDIATAKRLKTVKAAIDRVADPKKEAMRKRDPKLDRALLETGRTTKVLTRAALELGGGRAP